MPKVVNKDEKRKIIAKSTCSLFIEKGFVNISISQIAKSAGIGKGTIYEYFKNKEDIVFELMSCLQDDYDPKLKSNLQSANTVKEKVICLFSLFLDDDETTQIQRKIYKEFLSIYLSNPTDEIVNYRINLIDKYSLILDEILNDAVEKEELLEVSLQFVPSIFATFEGFCISNDNGKEQILKYLDNLLVLLSKNKGEI